MLAPFPVLYGLAVIALQKLLIRDELILFILAQSIPLIVLIGPCIPPIRSDDLRVVHFVFSVNWFSYLRPVRMVWVD